MASIRKESYVEGNNYIFLENLTQENDDAKVKVRVSRLWDTFNLKNNRELMSTDMVLIDEKGSYIHATIKSNIAHHFRGVFVEGVIYTIKNFPVTPNRSKYRVVLDNKLMIQLYANTIATEIRYDDTNFPTHQFDFEDFDNLEQRKGQDYILTDVIGRVVREGNVQSRKVNGKNVNFLTLGLENMWEKRVRITLWDRSAVDYQKQRDLLNNTIIVGVFSSNLVKEFMNTTTLSSTTATKIYLNVELPEVIQFKEKYTSCDGDNSIKPLDSHGQQITRQLILSKKKTISEILDVVASEYTDGIDYFCQASITNISTNNGWYYNSCPRCKRLIKPCGEKFWCNHCQKLMDDAVPRYRLELEVSDESDSTKFIIFDEEAEKLIGQPAMTIFSMEANEDGDNEGEMPCLIKNLINNSYVFRVKITSYNRTAYKQSFTANKVLEETILEEKKGEDTMLLPSNLTVETSISGVGSKPNSSTDLLNSPNKDAESECARKPSKKRRLTRIIHSDGEEDEFNVPSKKDELEDYD